MKSHDPIRWLDGPGAPLSPDQRAALRAYAQRGPSQSQRARMFGRVESVAGAKPSVGGSGRGLRWWWSVGGVSALVALLLTLLPRSPRQSTTPLVTHDSVAAQVASAPSPQEASAEPPPVSIPSAPVSQPSRNVSAPERVGKGPALPEHKPVGDPVAELALLTPARQLLATAPARTLALVEQHAQRFAQGVFAEERAFLRIEAFLRLGQHAAAEAAARKFRRAHPASTYLERLDRRLAPAPK